MITYVYVLFLGGISLVGFNCSIYELEWAKLYSEHLQVHIVPTQQQEKREKHSYQSRIHSEEPNKKHSVFNMYCHLLNFMKVKISG